MEKKKGKKKLIIVAIVIASILLAIPFILQPIATVIVYESIFNTRYETITWLAFSTDDFDGLKAERCDFESSGVDVAGYKYSKEGQDIKGVMILAHGLGGGGHNTYMPFIDYFASNGYLVFSYDAIGTDNSGGKSVKGLPQGVITLDNAINHVKSLDEYKNLPIVLFGHSWGGYSVGNVLNFHPEIKSVVIFAGFNESSDMIEHQSSQYVGGLTKVLLPYVTLYEQAKFGRKNVSISAISGLENTTAKAMIVHSKDDTTVPTKYGYDKWYERFSDNDRFQFVLYENKGHNTLFYSQSAIEYRNQINEEYRLFVEANGGEYTAQLQEEFMTANLDKGKLCEPDSQLMTAILAMFDLCCADC